MHQGDGCQVIELSAQLFKKWLRVIWRGGGVEGHAKLWQAQVGAMHRTKRLEQVLSPARLSKSHLGPLRDEQSKDLPLSTTAEAKVVGQAR